MYKFILCLDHQKLPLCCHFGGTKPRSNAFDPYVFVAVFLQDSSTIVY
jgi:hypothetical protein